MESIKKSVSLKGLHMPKSISQATMKKLINELYFKRVRKKRLEFPLGLPEFNPKILRPKRDLTQKAQKYSKDSCFPQQRTKTPNKAGGFGYIVGRRKDILGKTRYDSRRVTNLKLPHRLDASTEISRVVSPTIFIKGIRSSSLESRRSDNSDSADRTKLGNIMEYCASVMEKHGPRRVIYQSPLATELEARLKLLV
mmetsp:Transcript_7614/g.14339  ORF Transcript_7614/g.14339 Transcript_7614/m.14339 type:complete len:196 (-) Transcript_7614:2018-2605(-)